MRKIYEHLVEISQEEILLLDIKCKDCYTQLTLSNWLVGNRKQYKKYCNQCTVLRSNQYKKENRDKVNERKREWSANNKDKLAFYKRNVTSLDRKKSAIKTMYGLSWEDFLSLVEKANSSCQICGRVLYLLPKNIQDSICVDHCHETGKIRSILCKHCNTGIGLLQDSPKLLNKAAEYLFKYKEEKE